MKAAKKKLIISSNNGWSVESERERRAILPFFFESQVQSSISFIPTTVRRERSFVASKELPSPLPSSSSDDHHRTLQFHWEIYGSITFLTRRVKSCRYLFIYISARRVLSLTLKVFWNKFKCEIFPHPDEFGDEKKPRELISPNAWSHCVVPARERLDFICMSWTRFSVSL